MGKTVKVKRARELYQGFSLLASEPISNHILNFRLTSNVTGLQSIIENYAKREAEILLEHCEQVDGRPLYESNGQTPRWNEPKSQHEADAIKQLQEVLDVDVELSDSVKPIDWSLLEKSKVVFKDADGKRSTDNLAVSVPVQLLLGDFLTGEPTDSV